MLHGECGDCNLFPNCHCCDETPNEPGCGVNQRKRGTDDPMGPPSPPRNVGWSVGYEVAPANSNTSLFQRDTQFAKVGWMPNTESDLAGYHVEMASSPVGPWMRLTKNPVAWWENSYVVQGQWLQLERNSTVYIGPEKNCLVFRVIAVDEDGNESGPKCSITTMLSCSTSADCPSGETCSGVSTPPTQCEAPPPPRNLRVAAQELQPNNTCWVTLEWDRVFGTCTSAGTCSNNSGRACTINSDCSAAKYRIYRMKLGMGYYYFYRTQEQDANPAPGLTETYTERGDPDSPYASDPNTACPYCCYEPLDPTCAATGLLEAYYVTARYGNGGESMRSNVVFWNCSDGGYAKLLPADAEVYGDAIAQGVRSLDALGGFEVWNEGEAVCRAVETDPFTLSWSEAGDLALELPPSLEQTAATHAHVQERKSDSLPDHGWAMASMLTLGSLTDPPWKLHHLHSDHLGSVRLVTDDQGHVESLHDYFPFGEEIAPMLDHNTHLFTGHERDKETGLDYMLARYYGSSLSRFLSVDPSDRSVDRYRPQSWNRYAYVQNNPLIRIDPDGRKDKRSDADKKVLDDKDVKKDVQKAWKESKPEEKPANTQEVGFVVVVAKDGTYETTGTTTDGKPTAVNLPTPDAEGNIDGQKAAADVHTHPAGGERMKDPGTGNYATLKPEQSPRDIQNAKDRGLTSYVVAPGAIYRFDPAGDSSPKAILTGKDLKQYMEPSP